MDDFDSFSEFLAGLGKRATTKLPDSVILVGQTSNLMLPFQVDADYRLLLDAATPKYYGRNPVEVPSAAPGVLEAGPGGTDTRVVVNINVVNVTAAPVTLTMWLDEEDPPSDYYVFAICGGTVPANDRWQWTGVLPLQGNYSIYGQADAANSLYAHISLRDKLDAYRNP